MGIYQKLVQRIYLPRLGQLEKAIGCRLVFRHIPARYINAMMNCEMTKTWKKAGLDIEKGENYFTIGKVVNGESSRFDREAPEYQSWLGAYSIKTVSEKPWSTEDYFKLAIADQNNWLRWYGDPKPYTTTDGFKPVEISKLQLGRYYGMLYEFGCGTHSDVGLDQKTTRLRFASQSMAALFNLANPNLSLTASNFIPKRSDYAYETLNLKGFIAIFDIKPRVKIIFYGNGTLNTFAILKDDLLNAIKSCEITEIK